MTDARLKGGWLMMPLYQDLSDAGWRVFTNALMWSAEQGTDGRIPIRYARTFHPDDVDNALDELVNAGIAARVDNEIVLVGWSEKYGLGQSTATQVEEYRRKARERQQKHRSGGLVGVGSRSPSDALSSEVVTRDIRRDVGVGSTSLEETSTSAYVRRDVTRDISTGKHPHEPNARRALETIARERALPLSIDELVEHAYRIGTGDPWAGYQRIKQETEAKLSWASNPAAALRAKLEKSA